MLSIHAGTTEEKEPAVGSIGTKRVLSKRAGRSGWELGRWNAWDARDKTSPRWEAQDARDEKSRTVPSGRGHYSSAAGFSFADV